MARRQGPQPPAVTFHFVEQSTSGVLTLQRGATLATVRKNAHAAAKKQLEKVWDVDQNGIIHQALESVVIVSDSRGFIPYDDSDTRLASEVCDSALLALIPSPFEMNVAVVPTNMAVQVPFMLRSPLLDCKNQPSATGEDSQSALATISQLQEKLADLERKLRSVSEITVGLRRENEVLRRDNATLKRQVTELTDDLKKEQSTSTAPTDNYGVATNQQLAKLVMQNERLQRHMEVLEAVQDEHSRWIHSQDAILLDHIKEHHLLKIAQGKLAVVAGVATSGSHSIQASLAWKGALGPSRVLSERIARAHELLAATHVQLDIKTTQFIQSEAGMRLVSDIGSPIHTLGDSTAHPLSTPVKPVRVMRHEEREGISALMYFVCET